MIVIVGASASGKTEVSKILVEKYGFMKCVTTTTRLKRINEVDGIDYHFLTKEEFKLLISKNAFVEYAIYQDNFYGINKKDINKNALVIVEPNGANELIRKMKNNVFIVFFESQKDIRSKRMFERGDKIDDIQKRLHNDEKIFNKDNLLKVDLHIENDDHNLSEISKIIKDEYEKYIEKNLG
ncbi:guanylate kinase [Haploplasma axanthum]|uniref:Guanylate kinase n=1 Tax=Haploplasma axanthum TaxID=29552 RepID=A0A449BCR2_HAPAX|nr:guanylate kinase [Haploplasma axanthum]VEU80226.1 guanylate kinase [Haploplasma axanthum]